MTEEVKIIDGTYKKDDPHKDIGKQKFRVRQYYNAQVTYDVIATSKEEAEKAVIELGGIEEIVWEEGFSPDTPLEVYSSDFNFADTSSSEKIAECVPYEDVDIETNEEFLNYEDHEWSKDEFRWKDYDKQ